MDFFDSLPRLICIPGLKTVVKRVFFEGDDIETKELRCYIKSDFCVTDCAMFGCKKQGDRSVFVCRAPGRPVPIGVPHEDAFDYDVMSSFCVAIKK